MAFKEEGVNTPNVRELRRGKFDEALHKELQKWYANHQGQKMSLKIYQEIKSLVQSKFKKL